MKTILRAASAVALGAFAVAQIPECKDMKTTASGLQYGVLKKGREGPSPAATDMVEVHYTGWLTNGKQFDSSRERGQPAKFPLNGVIKGWTEGVQLMTPGARFKFVIPPELGYGDQDQGTIPPNSTLVFDVELLGFTALPKYEAGKPGAAQKKLPSGVTCEVLEVGKGPMVGEGEAVALKYAIFQEEKLAECTEQNGHVIAGTKDTLPFEFLKELLGEMRQGDVLRVEVPANVAPSLPKATVWRIELTGIHKLPKFRALDPEKTKTTASGLKYEVLKEGDGAQPKATDTVSALYTGWLPDGKMFDSAHARGMPSEFPLKQVIAGWTEGLQLMKAGGSCLFEIPGELAYGARGRPPLIPANQTLIFLVELVDVKSPDKPGDKPGETKQGNGK
jgi:FKBP-type peptidyl-prolyl cis-trans isomerase